MIAAIVLTIVVLSQLGIQITPLLFALWNLAIIIIPLALAGYLLILAKRYVDAKMQESKISDKKLDCPQQKNDFRLWRWLRNMLWGESKIEKLDRELCEVIDALPDLKPEQKKWLRERWLEQVLWWEGKAISFRNKYNLLRVLMIIFGAIVTALVSLPSNNNVIRLLTVVFSLAVTVSAALEGVFQFGERRRHKRKAVELLKSEGWQFFQLSGRYRRYGSSHAMAYAEFAARVEEMTQEEIEEYVAIMKEQKEKNEKR